MDILGEGAPSGFRPLEEQLGPQTPHQVIPFTPHQGRQAFMAVRPSWGGTVKGVTDGDNLHKQELTEYLFDSGPRHATCCCLLLPKPVNLCIFTSEPQGHYRLRTNYDKRWMRVSSGTLSVLNTQPWPFACGVNSLLRTRGF